MLNIPGHQSRQPELRTEATGGKTVECLKKLLVEWLPHKSCKRREMECLHADIKISRLLMHSFVAGAPTMGGQVPSYKLIEYRSLPAGQLLFNSQYIYGTLCCFNNWKTPFCKTWGTGLKGSFK